MTMLSLIERSSEIKIIPEKLEDLNERTKFLFFRDDPFRRFMIRSNEWLDFMERFYLWFSSNIELEVLHELDDFISLIG